MIALLKVLFNAFLFFVYITVTVTFWNFLYGYKLYKNWASIPGPSDPVHIKMALLISVFVLFVTLVFRKYFYLSIAKKSNWYIEVTDETPESKNNFFIESNENNQVNEVKKVVKPKKTKKPLKQKTKEGEVEILIGKEIRK